MKRKKSKKRSLFPSRKIFVFGIFFFGFLLVIVGAAQLSVYAQPLAGKHLRGVEHLVFRPVCGEHFKETAWCQAHVVTNSSGAPLNTTTPLSSSYGPLQFHTAYNLPCTPGGPEQVNCTQPTDFGGQTIAIITAYNDPNIEADLGTYTNYYGIPTCTKVNGCLTVMNQVGGSTLPGVTNSGWALETSLDVETTHMICQTCKILVVEANDGYISDLGIAANTAAALGATEISNSYGAAEWSSETAYDSYFNHPGIAVTVASGDNGYGTEFPAASPNVVAVGGTTLQINTDNTYGVENVWTGSGSGCSTYESANNWQKALSNWSQTACGNARAIADISADADPNTGAAVYDSIPYGGSTGWYQVGGTSLAAPLVAGMYALTGGLPTATNEASIPYASFNMTNSHDVTTGTNGLCTTTMCAAGSGYDGPSGLGTPNGILGLSLHSITPSPTSTPTATPTPSITSALTLTPTFSPTPTPGQGQTFTFGNSNIGSSLDTFDQNYIDGSRFRSSTKGGTLQSISVYVATVDSAPYNQYQVAIYSDRNGRPGTLLGHSVSGALIPNSWNTLSINTPIQANTYYWLVYNTNASSPSLNQLRYTSTGTFMGTYSASSVSFGIWPQSFSAGRDGYEYSIFATYK